MPPIKIRKVSNINEDLGNFGIIDGYVGIPVYFYGGVHDDINYHSCEYLE